ncbi:MAG: DUF1553 domain-containing protein [Verrucomicrobia bacterium]|nr:DUF1553 domain-containing protein [Verrucomicrobiota bacterium]
MKKFSRHLGRWFAAWLLLGLPVSRAADVSSAPAFTPAQRRHWAFQPIARREPPIIRHEQWAKNPIDQFIVAELEKRKIEPSPLADKITLLRRVSLDLTGLPPTLEEVDAFLADRSSHAYERVVNRLLASPHYGERWSRHWLDLARYAESEGFKADETRPNAWRYRDYVIKSLNQDKPYDRFLREQIAGDELWPDDPDARVATGFNRHYPDESNARNLMQRRQDILNDITDTVGAVFTGLTYACARCHDHKFDPILQTDYYRLQAFFANASAADNLVLASPTEQKAHREKLAVWEEKTRVTRDEMNAIEEPHREAIIKDYVDKYPEEIQVALRKPVKERTPFECQMVAKAKQYIDPESYQYLAPTSAIVGRLKGDQKKRWEELNDELKNSADLHPGNLPIGTGITDLSATAPGTHLLRRGMFDAPRDEVEPGFLAILNPSPTKILPTVAADSTGRRAALAELLTDPQNPLTARVIVNRLWHYHFGRGLVGTPSDFGLKGERPTNLALLDWLANEFMRTGWSLKQLHRLIVTSSTYRQVSNHRPEVARVDPDDKLLWHFPRQRLEGEVVRDASLAVSGLLNTKMGGPGIFPELPPGLESRGGWKVSDDSSERNRRSVYVFVRRNTRYPLFEAFDMPDTHESCARRNVTTSPIQALTLLNSKLSLEWAQAFAGRVLQSAGADVDKQIDTAYRLAYSRHPDSREQTMAKKFFSEQRRVITERRAASEPLALPAVLPKAVNPDHAAALVDFCHALMNANEFVYRN